MSELLTKKEIVDRRRSRYEARESDVDALGRIITVRPLKPSEQLRLMKMLDSSEDDLLRGMCSIAACVCEIKCHSEENAAQYSFPRSFDDICVVVDELQNEGLVAVTKAVTRLAEKTAKEAGEDASAKNSTTSTTSADSPG